MSNHGNLHLRHRRAALPIPESDAAPVLIEAREPAPAQTLVSVVYVTAAPTFEGPIGGYSTVGVEDSPDPTPAPAPVSAQAPASEQAPAPETNAQPTRDPTPSVQATANEVKPSPSSIVVDTSAKPKASSAQSTLDDSTDLPTAIANPKTSLSSSLALVAATGGVSSTLSSSATLAGASSASSTSDSTASSDASSSGMSAGGKAGLAIGILLLVGAILSIVLFCFKKRKDAAKRERLADEKMMEKDAFAGAGRASSTRTTATAPRLSLRPVTQFLPNLGERRQSRGNALMSAATPANAQNHDQNRENPFGNHAEAIDSTNANGPVPGAMSGPSREVVAAGTAVTAGAGAAGALTRSASKRGDGAGPMNFTKSGPLVAPPSPTPTEFSQSSETTTTPIPTATGAAIAAAGGPANTAVHRVQLDFKPSMEDELDLRAGQLIRLLHEYDDGWALCIRLDRSQQGVVPRTCLSTRPVKPRPQQNGPRGPAPGMRGPAPPGQARPMSPGMNGPPPGQARPMSPGMNGPPRGPPGQARPMSPASARPRTPNGANGPQYKPQRPITPQGQNRPRSPSATQTQGRRMTPPGPSPMNPGTQLDGAASPPLSQSPPSSIGRKPVPGQAL